MALFDNGDLKELLLFVRNSNMTLEVSVTLLAVTIIQYLRTLLQGEFLCQFDMLSAEVGSATPE